VGANLQGKQHILDAGNVVKLLWENTPHTVEKVGLNQIVDAYTLLSASLPVYLHQGIF
jgi:hypothetical protein